LNKAVKILYALLFFIPFGSVGQTALFDQGYWYKIGVPEEGVYKIDKNFLDQIGMDYSQPNTLKVFGNGMGMLPQANHEERPLGLIENSLKGYGLEDGIFDDNDFLLFYANGPHDWTWEDDLWQFEKNIYSDTSYYFITSGGAAGARVTEAPTYDPRNSIISSYMARKAHELDEVNLLGNSGRDWFEAYFKAGESRSYNFQTEGALDTIKAFIKVVGRSDLVGAFEIYEDETLLGQIAYNAINTGSGSTYDLKGDVQNEIFKFPVNNSETILTLKLPVVSGYDVLIGYLDQIVLTYASRLVLHNDFMLFSNPRVEEDTITYEVLSDEKIEVWDITHHLVESLPLYSVGSSHKYTALKNDQQRFLAFSNQNLPQPIAFHPIINQYITGLSPKDGLIITHPKFMASADRLARFHSTHDQLDVAVVTTTQIYNEFSSGMQDLTALRDAIKFYWSLNNSFRYVLLMGDCSFDYKDRIPNNTNFVPVYESRNAINPINSYSSDDYFGFLEDEEGLWRENNEGNHSLEIGIGRLPVKTQEEAKNMTDKIIRYASSERMYGSWKNDITYVVDDGDANLHQRAAETLADYFNDFQPQTQLNKLYIDAFPQEVLASRESALITREALINALEEGTFMVDYLGHGNENQWAVENILDATLINDLTNRFHLPLFLTATCEFGRYDDPSINTSGAEKLLLNQNGGAIALLTTTRPVYASSNELINTAFHNNLFKIENGSFLRLGDIMRLTKNASVSGVNNRNFSLLGDPMLRLQYPENKIVIDSINGLDVVDLGADTLSALEKILLKGSIQSIDSVFLSDFNGSVNVSIYDRITEKETLGQENPTFTYAVRENKIFEGEATVSNGHFSIEFIVPKNISYRFESGKIIMYAQNNDLTSDATGFFKDFVMGNTAENPNIENDRPAVTLYINNDSFNEGDLVGENGLFIAKITDESGINTSGIGINQDITLTMEDESIYILNDYYVADLDTYQSGSITFPLRNLSVGNHTATLKISDIHNNTSYRSVNFIVSNEPKLLLHNVMNYPNPAIDGTTFAFEHDRIGEALEIALTIYDTRGNIISEELFEIDDSPKKIDDLYLPFPPGKFRKGIYLYRIEVSSTQDQAKGSAIERLLINN
jgi:hypothetical protein